MKSPVRLLLVDDTATTLSQLADLLRDSGFLVDEAPDAEAALSLLAEREDDISFVILDQVLNGSVDGGTEVAKRITRLRPDVFIVMYTADSQIDDRKRYEALNAGAHRYIRKSNAEELLRDFGEFIEDMTELQALTEQIDAIANARRNMFSVLVGLDVRLSIIDREYRVWFTNREPSVTRGTKIMRCWTLFHQYPAEHGPCFACLIKTVIETGRSQSRTLARPSEGGELEWFRHDAMLIPHLSETEDRIMAVRETTQKLEHAVLSFDVKERLSILADSIVHLGYGRVRIYRATGKDRIRCEAVATRYEATDAARYREEAMGFETDASQNVYMRRALEEKDGTLTENIDTEHGLDPASRLRIRQEPPWIDLPIFLDSEFVGWLAVDTVGATRRELGMADIQKLAPFREELRRTLGGQSPTAGDVSRQILAEVRAALVSARGEDEALASVVLAAKKLLERVASCADVRVRVRQEGQLRLVRRLHPSGRPAPESVDEANPDSLAAYVVRFGNDLFIRNLQEYEEEAREKRLPPGLGPRVPNGLAILRAKFEEQTFGTLHVECEGELAWEQTGLREPLAELAQITALLLRDVVQNRRLERAGEAAERQLAQAFGAIHGVKGPAQACRNYLMTIGELHKRGKLSGAKAAELAKGAIIGLTRIERLADRLLRLVRDRTGEPGIVDVRGVLETCTREASYLYPGLTARFSVEQGSEFVRFDSAELAAVIDELIMNCERAGASAAEISVRHESHSWIMEVDDNGPGVPTDEHLERIFDRWFHTFAGGAGLGLAFVKKAITDLGGRVWAQHALPGLRITIALPMRGELHGE